MAFWKRFRRSRLLLALAVIGPGIIAGNADNDPSGIYGYSVAGATYGYSMLWLLALVILSLLIIQETCARMAVATGKGLGDLIREEFGVKVTLLAMIVLFVANLSTTVSEFAGMSAALDLLTGFKLHSIIIPFFTVALWMLVMHGSYKGIERFLLLASFIFLAYVICAIQANPNWTQVAEGFYKPHLTTNSDYFRIGVGLIGTTITPWGLFFIQSSIRDKGMSKKHYKYVRIDIIAGSIFVGLIAGCILICCAATLHPNGIALGSNADAADVAKALKPLVGNWSSILFAVGLLNAAFYGAIVVPLSTAYAITEALGWESGLGRRIKEAPLFAGVFGSSIFISALIVLISNPSISGFLIQLPNFVGGMLLPIILVLIIKLVNNKELMGAMVNNRWQNFAMWSMVIIITLFSFALVGFSIYDKFM